MGHTVPRAVVLVGVLVVVGVVVVVEVVIVFGFVVAVGVMVVVRVELVIAFAVVVGVVVFVTVVVVAKVVVVVEVVVVFRVMMLPGIQWISNQRRNELYRNIRISCFFKTNNITYENIHKSILKREQAHLAPNHHLSCSWPLHQNQSSSMAICAYDCCSSLYSTRKWTVHCEPCCIQIGIGWECSRLGILMPPVHQFYI